MILKTNGLVLRVMPYHETSQIIVWLTEEYGKMATLAKGAQRARSPLLGQYDLFYTCEVVFYAREQRNMHILKESCPLEFRHSFREDWKACAAASYAASLIDAVVPFGPPQPGFFDLLLHTFRELETRSPGPSFLLYVELNLLQLLGLSPSWTHCGNCGTLLAGASGGTGGISIDTAQGHVYCPTCAAVQSGQKLLPGTLEALRKMSVARPDWALPARNFEEIRHILGELLEHHADISTVARRRAMDILRLSDAAHAL